MFKRITLPKAIIISLLCHLFFFFSVVIVITPVTLRKSRFSKINFIGSILDKDTFGYFKAKDGLANDYLKGISMGNLIGKGSSLVFFQEERLKHARLNPYVDKPYAGSITEIIDESKNMPQGTSLLIKQLGATAAPQIRSEVAKRRVLFKPTVPVINRVFRTGKVPSKGEKFQVQLKFLVSPVGDVVFIEKMKSCGYPDIDLEAIRYMKKWQFAPLEASRAKRDQEGIMLLELEAQ